MTPLITSSNLVDHFKNFERTDFIGTLKNLPGTKDYLPYQYTNKNISSETFRNLESIFVEVCKTFGAGEILLPILETADLYSRNIGDTTDIVEKEMFLTEANKDVIALRPEGTAGVARSFMQNKVYVSPNELVKLYYKGSMFRKERPQAGRQREFTQFGVEVIGSKDPLTDVEVISMAIMFFSKLGMKDLLLEINSIGCSTCRNEYKTALRDFLNSLDELCDDCQSRLVKNPLRALDCKNSNCRAKMTDIPLITTYLCEPCSTDYVTLKIGLDTLEIEYVENPRLVRGLDYYEKTVFEFIDSSIGAQSTFCGGGRYTGLMKDTNGADMPGVGFALGLERLAIVLENLQLLPDVQPKLDYFLIWSNETSKLVQMKVARVLREKGYSVEMEFAPKKIRNAFKVADRKKARYVGIMCEDELTKGTINIKDMNTSDQCELPLQEFLTTI